MRVFALRAVALLLSLVTGSPWEIAADCRAPTKAECRIFLECSEDEENEIKAELKLLSHEGICAAFAEIYYDDSELLYLGGGSECPLELSCVDTGGCVRFLLDGTENTDGECILASFYFSRIGSGETELYFTDEAGTTVIYLDENREVAACDAELSGCVIEGEPPLEIIEVPPAFISFTKESSCDGSAISFEVTVGEDCFAAGVRIFIVDLESGEHEDLSMAGVIGKDRCFKGRYELSKDRSLSVVFTALGYNRSGEKRGEKVTEMLNLG